MISAIAILFGTLVAGNLCEDEFYNTGKNLALCAVQLDDALTVCDTNPAACNADIAGVVEFMGAAIQSINDAATDCEGRGTTCDNDIAKIVSDIAEATTNITSAVDDCVNGGVKCKTDISNAREDVTSAINMFIITAKDCSVGQLLAPSITELVTSNITDSCKDEVATIGKDLADSAIDIVKVISDCPKNEDKCAEDLSDIEKQIGEAAAMINRAVLDCGLISSECKNDIEKVIEDLDSARTAIARVVDDCANKFGTDCKSDVMAAASVTWMAAVDISKATSACVRKDIKFTA